MFKRIAIHSLMIVLSIGMLAACAAPIAPVATNTPIAATTGAPTLVPTKAAPTPASAPTTNTAAVSFCAEVNPSQFRMNTTGLPYSWQANCVAARPYDKTQPPEQRGLPEHVEINFSVTNPANQKPGDPVLYIISKQDYVNMWTAGGDDTVVNRMIQLEDMVLQKGAGMKLSGMPVLPVERASAANDLAVQGKYLDFGNWSGLRFVGRSSQGLNPVVNTDPQLFYVFQGFAGPQNKYFVSLFYPVTTPYLPMDVSGVPTAEMQRFNADVNAYMQERSTCTPVHIEAGQGVAGIDVMLLRTVNTAAPPVGAQVVALPTLSWQSFPDAVKYEVFVIDAGTTELKQHEFAADTHFTVTAPLQPDRTYEWVVNAVAADGGQLATGDSRFMVQP